MALKDLVYKALPKYVAEWYSAQKVKRIMKRFQNHYPTVVERLKGEEKLTVAFYLINASVWKLDELFRLMMRDERFEPIVVLCPLTAFDNDEHRNRELNSIEQFVKDQGYPYVNTKLEHGQWLDVKNTVNPDINFFTTPYLYNTMSQYYVLNFPDSLNCYVTYSSMNFWDFKWELNLPFHNYIWRYFAENDKIKGYMETAGFYKGENCFVSGFPVFDAYLRNDYKPEKSWKHNQSIRIIWAPHHTIDNCKILHYSNFLDIAEPMIELSKKFVDKVQFSFKPHPMLRPKLEQVWGKERTLEYYLFWESGVNTQFDDGQYVDLFYTSDAMIFDSSSFITEYIYADKPSLFINKKNTENMLNEFGKEAIECHQDAQTIEEIEHFINNVINGQDLHKAKRYAFIDKYIKPYNTPSASQNIINHIVETITR